MNESSVESDHRNGLRFIAESRIESGTAPLTTRGTLGVDALAVLHRLASGPDSVGDSLKLLHELQTYQVELDLQHEQLLENEREIEQELARYKTLYEAAPAGYLVIDPRGPVLEANQAAADLFGVQRSELQGALLRNFVAGGSRPVLEEMHKKLVAGEPSSSCVVSAGEDTASSRGLRINARIAPDGDAILMMMCECECATATD